MAQNRKPSGLEYKKFETSQLVNDRVEVSPDVPKDTIRDNFNPDDMLVTRTGAEETPSPEKED